MPALYSKPISEYLANTKGIRNLLGRRFGYLFVIAYHGRINKRTKWWCVCVCGKAHSVRADQLLDGQSKSCGCKYADLHLLSRGTHGQSRAGSVSPEYHAYQAAQQRCTNPKDPGYRNYGGRGIRFLFTSFDAFFAEVGPRPGKGYSLDRIDNNDNYAPGNVKWSTRSDQHRNKRKMGLIERFTTDELLDELARRSVFPSE